MIMSLMSSYVLFYSSIINSMVFLFDANRWNWSPHLRFVLLFKVVDVVEEIHDLKLLVVFYVLSDTITEFVAFLYLSRASSIRPCLKRLVPLVYDIQ